MHTFLLQITLMLYTSRTGKEGVGYALKWSMPQLDVHPFPNGIGVGALAKALTSDIHLSSLLWHIRILWMFIAQGHIVNTLTFAHNEVVTNELQIHDYVHLLHI
jgi:hypothetical protein